MENQEIKPVMLAITKVRDSKFSMDETLFDTSTNEPYKVDFNFLTGYNLETSRIIFTIITRYHTQSEGLPIFLEMSVDNEFVVQNLNDYILNNLINFTVETWAAIIGMGVSHSRALISRRTFGTVYENCLLPIINPFDLAAQFLALQKAGE